jgi:hypothetical protein
MKVQLRFEGIVLDEEDLLESPMLPYVRMLVRLIDGVRLAPEAVVDWLLRSMRQRSMAYRSRMDYVLGFLHLHPP